MPKVRKAAPSTPKKRGRPNEGKTDRLHVRLPPDLKAKVAERGGSAWVLALIRSAP